MTANTETEQLHQLLELVLTELDRKAIPVAYMQEIDRKGKAFIEQAARRAPAAPVHTTSAHSTPMCGAAPKVEPIAWYVTGCSTMLDEHDAKAEAKRCGGTAQAVPLYAAPQPQEAAPVQLPEPVAFALEWTFNGEERGMRLYDDETHCRFDAESDGGVCHPLYSEQQVRDLLANHGIKVNQ